MRDVDVDVIVSPKKKMQQTFYFNMSEMVKIDREILHTLQKHHHEEKA